jgi:hypothetical protein
MGFYRAVNLAVLFAIAIQPTALLRAETVEETILELKAQMKVMQGRIDELERQVVQERQAKQGKTTSQPTTVFKTTETGKSFPDRSSSKDNKKTTVDVPGLNTSVTVGGRIKLDTVYNSVSVGGAGGSNRSDVALIPGAIPVNASDEDDQFSFSARESRLWVKSRTPTPYWALGAYIEMDFAATQSSGNERVSNSHTPRLRHGYGVFGNLLLGQTWSTFMNVGSFPENNDSTGPVAMIDIRQPQLRWTQPFEHWDLQVAIEQPETTLTSATGGRVTPDDDRIPDLIGKAVFQGDWGQFSLAGMLREIRSDGAVVVGVDDSSLGGALSLAGRLKVRGRDNLRFTLNYGNALGRYTALNAFNAGSIDSTGDIALMDLYSGFLSYQHWWNRKLRSSLTYSIASADNDLTRVPGSVTEWIDTFHANMLWSPVLQTTFGLEYIHAYRLLENDDDGDLNRLQFSAIYNF